MTRPRAFLQSQMVPGKYVYGYTCPGFSYYGEYRPFAAQSIYALEDYGSQIVGFNLLDEYLPHCKKFAPVESLRASRQFAGRTIFYQQHGNQLLMRYQPYHSSPKEHLYPWVLLLMESSFLWSCLTDENKARLSADAKRTRQATQGHNYFTKLYIAGDPRWMDYV